MDGGASHILPRKIGAARATALAMLAQTIDADQAVGLGLALKQCEEDALQGEAEKLAQKLASGPTRALGLIKEELEFAQSASLADALAFEASVQAKAFASKDFEEGITAFSQKRKPQFRGM